MTNLRAPSQAAVRKRRQRANQSKDGLHRMEFTFTDLEKEALDYLCVNRNPGREPYDRNELVSLLLLCNLEHLKRQQSNCWLTRDARQLNLTDVTGHANLEETD